MVCRPLMRLELWHKLTKWAHDLRTQEIDALYREAVDRLGRPQLRLPIPFRVGKRLEAKRDFLVRSGDELLDTIFGPVNLASKRLTNDLLEAVLEEIVRWGLGSNDAVVTALARRAVTDFCSPPPSLFDGSRV